jgi:hypothetical protein
MKPKRLSTYVPGVPQSPDNYSSVHQDRIDEFPNRIAERDIIRSELGEQSPVWRHSLDNDAESVFWLLVYWAVVVQPKHRKKELKEHINSHFWTGLIGDSDERHGLIKLLSEEHWEKKLTHSVYEPLETLISQLSSFLIVDRHWLPESDCRSKPEYLNEAFQRLILKFIIENRHASFMDRAIDKTLRTVAEVPDSAARSSKRASEASGGKGKRSRIE